jgi:phosphomevalonate kinase
LRVTRARAPGKVVLSGAYAVLSGSPAIVTAVSRYVTADTSRAAELVTDEVRAALEPGERAPWFDAAELRQDGRKLGLGSSAAILAASLFALEHAAAPRVDQAALQKRVFERALSAHRAAQGGGSGVDVAASSFGGMLVYRLLAAGPVLQPVALPSELTIELWICPSSASTRELLAAVDRLAQVAPQEHAARLSAQAAASLAAVDSVEQRDPAGLLTALRAQQRALLGLGRAAGVPIVTPALVELGPLAEAEGGVLLPAGAGGGDIALFVGSGPSSGALRGALENRAHRLLPTRLAAPGVALVSEQA